LTYFAGKQISGRAAVGVLASLMVAVSPTNAWHSRVMKPDSFVTFFSLASFLASTLVYQQGKTRHYVVAGLCAGLTASSKYNGGLITFSLIIAHFLRCGRTSFKEPKLYLALFLCVAGFIATTPYAVLDSSEFLAGLRSEARHYATGHAGMEGDSLAWYLDYMWDTGGGLYLLALAGLVYGFRRRPKETGLLACFPLVYFALVSGFLVRNDRTFLPMIAFLCVAVAWCLVDVFGKCNALKAVSLRRLMLAVPAVLTIAALATPMSRTIADGRGLAAVDSRETARIWIDGNLPRGSRIAIESYSPFVDPSRYSVMGFRRMIDNDANWYRREGFEYLVFSELLYGRFYEKSERYRSAAERYERLFSEFSLVTVFTEGGHDIRVYRVKRGRLSPDPSSPRTR
jgi:4-amino-4-deoxy-L-arabinose transferase-like glycosyltransferase